jgi:hypothetical protein
MTSVALPLLPVLWMTAQNGLIHLGGALHHRH